MTDWISWSFRISGPLDLERLEHAVLRVVSRHEALRVTFRRTGQQHWEQCIRPAAKVLPMTVAVHRAHGQPEAVIQDVVRRYDTDSKDLRLRAVVVELDDDDHLVVIMIDHLVADAWSCTVILDEVGAFYGNFRDADLVSQPRCFGDWLAARTSLFPTRPRHHADVERVLVADGSPYGFVDLPVRIPLDVPASRRADVAAFDLSALEIARIFEHARSNRVSLFTLLASAVGTAILSMASRPDVMLYTFPANRQFPEFRDTVGWLSGKALIFATQAEIAIHGNAALSDAVADALGEGGLWTEYLHARSGAPGALPTKPSVAVNYYSTLDQPRLSLSQLEVQDVTPGRRPLVGGGRISFDMRHGHGMLRLEAMYEPGRFDAALINELMDRVRSTIVDGIPICHSRSISGPEVEGTVAPAVRNESAEGEHA